MLIASDATENFLPDEIVVILSIAFWSAIAIGVAVRVIVALVRRRPRQIAETVLRPMTDSAAAQSAALGWPPAAADSVVDDPAEPTSSSEP